MNTSTIAIVVFTVNLIFSAIILFTDRYDGFRTVTGFVTNVMIVLKLLWTQVSFSRYAMKKSIAISMLNTKPTIYNNIDHTLKESTTYFKPRAEVVFVENPLSPKRA